jgi:hypothetical protein
MKTIRRVDLARSEVDYLKTAGFLPLVLLECLQGVRWQSEAAGTLEVSATNAEAFREAFTEQLAKVGFNEAYEPTAEGGLLEDLIDHFHQGDGATE